MGNYCLIIIRKIKKINKLNLIDMNFEKFDRYLHCETRSIVVNGSFTPSLFQPAWFASKGLVGKEEAESAVIHVIIPDFCQITIGGFEILCNRNKFQILTRKSPYFEAMYDLVKQIFMLCPETPVKNVGLNTTFTFDLQSSELYYNIGSELASLHRWNDMMPNARLQNISLEGDKDDNNCKTFLQINPTGVERVSFGVDFAINNHFVLDKKNGDAVVALINEHSDEYMRKSKELACCTIDEFVR